MFFRDILIEDRPNLNKLCDEMVKGNITVEDILSGCDFAESTTTEPDTTSPMLTIGNPSPTAKPNIESVRLYVYV